MKTLDEAYSPLAKEGQPRLRRRADSSIQAGRHAHARYQRRIRPRRAQALRQRLPKPPAERADDEAFMPESAEKWGIWCVKKLYLHLGRENTVTMDWRVPLSSMGGKTGLELAQEAYAFHITRHKTSFVVTDEGRTSNAKFSPSLFLSQKTASAAISLNTSRRTARTLPDAETASAPERREAFSARANINASARLIRPRPTSRGPSRSPHWMHAAIRSRRACL